ncbi:hypothetical protein Tco_0754135 [Tanacetum coccineum]
MNSLRLGAVDGLDETVRGYQGRCLGLEGVSLTVPLMLIEPQVLLTVGPDLLQKLEEGHKLLFSAFGQRLLEYVYVCVDIEEKKREGKRKGIASDDLKVQVKKEIIVNGDAPAIFAIPDEHLLKFHGIKDAKTL